MNNSILLNNIDKYYIINILEIKELKLNKHFIFKKCYSDLNENKNMIDNHLNEWNLLKKYINPYELIYSPHSRKYISKYKPVSRSFFKLWEMINKFKLLDSKKQNIISNIAEGPGGFIECLLKYSNDDIIYSTTLYPSNKDIPSWDKLKNKMKNKKNLHLFYHNIYNYSEFLNYIDNFKNNKADFITADGGFDYSCDFNRQEEMSYRIIISEIIIALSIQKKGGNFLIKIFDIFTIFTLKYIYLLYLVYDEVHIHKPLTSRVANSEKYIICKNFKGIDKKLLENLIEIYKNFEKYDNKNIDITNFKLPNNFILQINEFNKKYVENQINFINKTINIIKKNETCNIDELIEKQIINAKKWCHIYKFNEFIS